MIGESEASYRINGDGEEPAPDPSWQDRVFTRRNALTVGGYGLLAGAVAFFGVPAYLDYEERRKTEEAERAAEIAAASKRRDEDAARGMAAYLDAFHSSVITELTPGLIDVPVVNNPALAMFTAETPLPEGLAKESDWAWRRDIGDRKVFKEGTKTTSPPHKLMRPYDGMPEWTPIGRDDSDLVAFPNHQRPELKVPSRILAVVAGPEGFDGHITVNVATDRMDVVNKGFEELPLHLLAVAE